MTGRQRASAAAAFCMAIVVAACQRGAPPPPADTAPDVAAIRQVLERISTAFNAGDLDGMFAQYRDDVLVSAPGSPNIVGKAAWRAALQRSLPPDVDITLRFFTEELEIAGDLAYERGTYLLENSDKATGATLPPGAGRHIHIFRREADGSWKGWRLMENSAAPAATSPP